ncbi:MAG TPA: hypothetical protein VGC26_11755 [Afipia sp.]
MAYQRDPSDLNRTEGLRTDELRRRQALDNELQPDPELAEGPAGAGRMAMMAIAVIAILGVVFYGLNNSTSVTSTAQKQPATTTSSTPPAQQNTQNNTMSPANPNANPGQTTGAAPTVPQSGAPSSESNNSGSRRTKLAADRQQRLQSVSLVAALQI